MTAFTAIRSRGRRTEFDASTTGVGFVVLVLVGLGVAWMAPMGRRTVLVMVLPALVIFGLDTLVLGVKHGEFRASIER